MATPVDHAELRRNASHGRTVHISPQLSIIVWGSLYFRPDVDDVVERIRQALLPIVDNVGV